MPFIFNTQGPLSDIWLLRYKQNSFGCVRKKSEFKFLQKTPKTGLGGGDGFGCRYPQFQKLEKLVVQSNFLLFGHTVKKHIIPV